MYQPDQKVLLNSKKTALKQYFGYDSFRDNQESIIDSALLDKDTLGILPTGGGKSVCFQLPNLIKGGLAIVITPLIALMKDQVQSLMNRGIAATFVHSGMDKRQINSIYIDAKNGVFKFLYLAPERISSKNLLRHLKDMPVSYIVVDEAHCISQWGFSFRTSYMSIPRLRKIFPTTPIIAVTATANEQVILDIKASLKFRDNHTMVKGTFYRPNLHIAITKTEKKISQIINYLKQRPDICAVVYVRRRAKAENYSKMIADAGLSATFYHGGMNPKDRNHNQDLWIRGSRNIMVATHAFGMGVDKANVRAVFHVDLPENLEAYYQEIGRAGRDGEDSDCILLYNDKDVDRYERSKDTFTTEPLMRKVYFQIVRKIKADGEEKQSMIINVEQFSKEIDVHPNVSATSIRTLEREGYLSMSSYSHTKADIELLKSKEEFEELRTQGYSYSVFVFHLLRQIKGRFYQTISIDERKLRKSAGLDLNHYSITMNNLSNRGFLNYIPKQPTFMITLKKIVDESKFTVDKKFVENRSDYADWQSSELMDFINNTTDCRAIKILSYFSEKMDKGCGNCDVCKRKKK